MQKMALAEGGENEEVLEPPSPRILRILSKTFALWQDTWYYDRRQMEMGHLETFLLDKKIRDEVNLICPLSGEYSSISIPKRQALAVYV